jgi:hypothetical protein
MVFLDQSVSKELALFFRDVTDEPEKTGNWRTPEI